MKNLSIAYNVSKKKKMAKGGKVNETAASEHRPSPEEKDKDSQEVAQNNSKKTLSQDKMLSRPDMVSQNKPKIQPIKHPSMAQSPVFKVKLRDQEDHLESSEAPTSPKEQPPKADNEVGAKKSGPSVPALHMKKMAEGGEINEAVSMHEAEKDHVQHPKGLESDNDQIGDKDAMLDHFADGGMAHDEIEDEKHSSIASAIMAKRDRMHAMIDSGALDEDHAANAYAEGGEVDIESNAKEQPNRYDARNAAILKENYDSDMDKVHEPRDSAQYADIHEESEENKHDMIAKIRSKMNVKRQFSK